MKKAREMGLKVGLFRPITIWPFPEARLKEIAKNAKSIIVAEMNYGQLVLEVERVVKDAADIYHVGKINGEVISPDEILSKIKEVI
jgi:2-oxoglutarate ferredoxin oxidoreductase subunit alpha